MSFLCDTPPNAMPLFTNHHAMMINARHTLCPELLCTHFLPAPRLCQYGPNEGKYYVACFNKAHGARYKFWDLGVHPRNAAQQNNAPPPTPLSSTQTATAKPPPRLSVKCISCTRLENAQIHETRPPALSTSTHEILDAGLAEAAAAFPAPPCRQHKFLDAEAAAAFPALRRRQHELPHQRLARQQEAVARLAVLTPLPPSPTLLQEERDKVLALRLAVGTSPPPSITAPHTRRISLVSWVLCGEASTTVVQDVAGWALTWPTIHLTNLTPFLLSPVHSRLDAYYDLFNFHIGQWVAILQAYAFDVVTDEPVLLRRVGTVADDEDEVIASFARFINRNLYPRVTTPKSRQLDKRRKYEPEPAGSSSDELEVSKVTQIVKMEPMTPPTFCRHPAPAGAPFTATIASTSRRLFSSSLPPVASSSRLSTSSSFEARCASSSSPFPSTPSLGFSYSSASSSSLASAGSSSRNPIQYFDEKDENSCEFF
ncbi:hypothetical protein DFH08DRAFT_969621 [Mycena albidolilacea]|uniref:Uncharacterized protein n=1 Tax=Mycena albidolilacea TaxID=1033008 RepID=A0AAD7EH27_9AGAR|nr:hypothetical protein DFH08DRAFT_969621 [Mycena albidolilacea]